MKRFAAILFLASVSTIASAQGLVNFLNNANSLISTSPAGVVWGPESFYFGLLTSPVGANTFTFTGVYGTNQNVPGRFSGGLSVSVAGWTPGTVRDFKVAGWDSILGPTFDPNWLSIAPTYFSLSGVATGAAGGFDGTGSLPNLNIFNGTFGIQNGFLINTSLTPQTPEPSGLGLVGLGAVLSFILRGRTKSRVRIVPST